MYYSFYFPSTLIYHMVMVLLLTLLLFCNPTPRSILFLKGGNEFNQLHMDLSLFRQIVCFAVTHSINYSLNLFSFLSFF